jgi:WD40 repeat protein
VKVPAPETDSSGLPVVPDGTYTEREEFARGGLGRVLRATDRGMGRVVAIKELLPGKQFAAQRFIREALVTGRLEHPSIVPVYEAGRWPSGEPFYTMKLVSGRPLSAVVRATEGLEERLALVPSVIAVAEAIAYAHSKRVIHRDIKPSNVIVGEFGETVVIDWGLAKELGRDDDDDVEAPGDAGDELTVAGDVLGTPAYMAPEQAKGDSVDERTDVYALGSLLYFVLAGVSPHKPLGEGGSGNAVNFVRDGGADSSTVAGGGPPEATGADAVTVAATRTPVPLARRRTDVPGELDAIVRKAMARDPARRYPSAREFADDLKAFQTGRLVSAHHYTLVGLTRRWVRRNRVAVTVAAVAAALLVAGAAYSLNHILDARNSAVSARAAESEARAQAERRSDELVLLQARASLTRDPTATLAWLKTYPARAPGWDRARQAVAEAVARGVSRDVWKIGEGAVSTVAVSADGRLLAAAAGDGQVRVLDLATRRWRSLGSVGGTGAEVALGPDGKSLAAGGDGRAVVVFPLDGGAARTLGRHDDTVTDVAFAPDGSLLASAGVDRVVRLWRPSGGAVSVLAGHELVVTSVAFSPDGTTLASGSEDATVRLWEVASGRELKVLHADRSVLRLAFAPDGRRLAGATRSGVRVWDLATGTARPLGESAPAEAYGVAWDPSGRLVTAGVDGLAVWDRAFTGAHLLLGHDGPVGSATVTPDGQTVVSGGADGTVRVWPLRPDAGVTLRDDNQPPGTGPRPRVSPDGRWIAAPGQDGTILVVNPSGVARTLTGHSGAVREIAFAPDSAHLASFGLDRSVRIWDLANGAGRVLTVLPTQAFRLRYAPSGRTLALTQGYEELDLIDVASGKISCVFRGHNDSASEFAPDGARIAFADRYGLVVGDVATCTSRPVHEHTGSLFGLAWSPDGQRIASASADHTVALGPVDGGAAPLFLRAHDREVYAVTFAPDGQRLASVGFDGVARVWDTGSGRLQLTLRGHEKVLLFVAFTPDGRALVTAGADDTVRVWDAQSGDLLQRETDTGLGGIALAPDGGWLVSAGPRGLRRWPLDRRDAVPAEPEALLAFIATATTAEVGEDGARAETRR